MSSSTPSLLSTISNGVVKVKSLPLNIRTLLVDGVPVTSSNVTKVVLPAPVRLFCDVEINLPCEELYMITSPSLKLVVNKPAKVASAPS